MKRKTGWFIATAALATLSVILIMSFLSNGNFLRGLTHNTAVLDTGSTDPFLRPFTMKGDIGSASKRIKEWAGKQPLWSVRDVEKGVNNIANNDGDMEGSGTKHEDTGDAAHSLAMIHLTRTTRVFRFVDDIHLNLSEQEPGVVEVNASSQSRLGKGDLGQNARNLKTLVQAITGKSP